MNYCGSDNSLHTSKAMLIIYSGLLQEDLVIHVDLFCGTLLRSPAEPLLGPFGFRGPDF